MMIPIFFKKNLLVLFILFNFSGYCQSQPFQFIPNYDPLLESPIIADFTITSDDEITLSGGEYNFLDTTRNYFVIPFYSNETTQEGFLFRLKNWGNAIPGTFHTKQVNQNVIVAITFSPVFTPNIFFGLNIFNIDLQNGEGWMRGKQGGGYTSTFGIEITIDNNYFLVASPTDNNPNYISQNVFEAFLLAPNGQTLWKKGYDLIDTLFQSEHIITHGVAINNNHYIYGQFRGDSGFFEDAFVIKLDSLGNVITSRRIRHHLIDQLYIGNDNEIYMLGKTNAEFDFTNNEENAVLVKLDENLNEIWTKVYHAEEFEFSKVSLNIGENGNLYLGYSTFGAFPVILAKLNNNGEIIWEKGYPFFQPEIKILSNGSIAMLVRGHFDDLGNIFPQEIIVKTDSLGNLAGCETFPSCLFVNPLETTFSNFEIETLTISDLDSFEVIVEPHTFTFENFCDIPSPPSPEFSFADTVCINSCETTNSTYNDFAHGIEWQFIGNGMDSIIRDSLNFSYCFEEPGEYTLIQNIWFLGCEYSFEKTITVLENLDVEITPNQILCENFPTSIGLNSNRLLKEFSWNNNETTAEIIIQNEGFFSVTVSDGFCFAQDSFWIEQIINSSCELDLIIPNAFTPDGDQVNDIFMIENEFVEIRSMKIFNRWGNKIFDGVGANTKWDGKCNDKNCSSDVYVYQVQYINLINNNIEQKIGDVTLIR